jgi:hypothetical protein
VAMYGSWKSERRRSACVPLPAPGGPNRIRLSSDTRAPLYRAARDEVSEDSAVPTRAVRTRTRTEEHTGPEPRARLRPDAFGRCGSRPRGGVGDLADASASPPTTGAGPASMPVPPRPVEAAPAVPSSPSYVCPQPGSAPPDPLPSTTAPTMSPRPHAPPTHPLCTSAPTTDPRPRAPPDPSALFNLRVMRCR